MSARPFQLQHLDHVVLRVRDSAAMEAFYCNVLGCTPERRQDDIGLVQLRAGRSLIDLVSPRSGAGQVTEPAGQLVHNMHHLCLRVDPFDREAIAAWLEGHGVRLGGFGSRYGAEGEGPSQYLFDPEGNLVELKGPAGRAAG